MPHFNLNQMKTYGIALLVNGEVAAIFEDHDDRNTGLAGVSFLREKGCNYRGHREQQVMAFGQRTHGLAPLHTEVKQFWELGPNEGYEILLKLREKYGEER